MPSAVGIYCKYGVKGLLLILRATPFVRFCSSTFFCARKNASHCFIGGWQRQLQPERYMPFFAICLKKRIRNWILTGI